MASETPFLVIGLGNPGPKYDNTPHNLGFDVVDLLANRVGATFSKKGKSLRAEGSLDGKKVILLKPQTYMNLSGEAVREVVDFYKLNPAQDLIVVLDDLDQPAGQLRIRLSGGSGGHNGLKSINQHLSSEGFPRLRIGVGRHPTMAPADYILHKVSGEVRDVLRTAVARAADAVVKASKEGVTGAMNEFNRRETKDES
jgi:peptidyl-tRNA hydrolase, PTH1 family